MLTDDQRRCLAWLEIEDRRLRPVECRTYQVFVSDANSPAKHEFPEGTVCVIVATASEARTYMLGTSGKVLNKRTSHLI